MPSRMSTRRQKPRNRNGMGFDSTKVKVTVSVLLARISGVK